MMAATKMCPSCGSQKVALSPDPEFSYCEACRWRGQTGETFARQAFPVTSYLSQDEYLALRKLADGEERSMSQVIRRLIRDAVGQEV